ncbi:MAG: hypothetical protein ABSF28_23860 [Terracidiphilus sp.]|jgi:hypothetical protein
MKLQHTIKDPDGSYEVEIGFDEDDRSVRSFRLTIENRERGYKPKHSESLLLVRIVAELLGRSGVNQGANLRDSVSIISDGCDEAKLLHDVLLVKLNPELPEGTQRDNERPDVKIIDGTPSGDGKKCYKNKAFGLKRESGCGKGLAPYGLYNLKLGLVGKLTADKFERMSDEIRKVYPGSYPGLGDYHSTDLNFASFCPHGR